MPHQCTTCGHVFADGSKEMLSGCPDCGGNKFQFHPDGADIPDRPEPDAEPPERPAEDSVAGTVGNAAATVRNLVSGGSEPDRAATQADTAEPSTAGGDTTEADERVAGVAVDEDRATAASTARDPSVDAEDAAQASARTDVVSPDELPDKETATPPGEGTVVDEPDTTPDDRPDLSELREELNQQFESIKVLEPGQYELNLMELYDREEYIIALQEDGKYSIQVPESWRD